MSKGGYERLFLPMLLSPWQALAWGIHFGGYDKLFLLWALSYLIGSVPTGYWAGRVFKGLDLREHGSKNIGATNAWRVMGAQWGVMVLLIDVLKGLLPVVWLAPLLAGPSFPLSLEGAKVVAGLGAIMGHNWTFFLGFKGGKGVATTAGVFLGISWQVMLIILAIFALVVGISRYISLGSITCALLLPVFMYLFHGMGVYFFLSVTACLGMLYKHRSNIERLKKRQESQIL